MPTNALIAAANSIRSFMTFLLTVECGRHLWCGLLFGPLMLKAYDSLSSINLRQQTLLAADEVLAPLAENRLLHDRAPFVTTNAVICGPCRNS